MTAQAIPFDAKRLDRLMDEAGIDVLLATSKHNVQYLLGGHRSIFFDYMDAIGVSPLSADHRLSEGQARQGRVFRPSAGRLPARGEAVLDARSADEFIRRARHDEARRPTTCRKPALPAKRIGIETTFMPMDAGAALRKALPECRHPGCAGGAGAAAAAQVAGRARDAARPRPRRSSTRCWRRSRSMAPARPRPKSPRRCAARRSTAGSPSSIA